MLTDLPPELIHEIVILASPRILLSYDPKTPAADNPLQLWPPTVVANIAQTCSKLNAILEYKMNALLYARIFERTFDFDAARRRLGAEWANPHGLAWEGKRRWIVIKRMKRVVASWERDGCRSLAWVDSYGEEDVLSDLWTIYFMILENDGKNGVLLVHGADLGAYVEMLCGLFFGRRLVRRVGWPKERQERALLAWILCAWDPMPNDFNDQDMYHKTKLSMRAFAFGSFKYSLGTLPPTYFHHPSRRNPSHYRHQDTPTAIAPYPLTSPWSSSRYTSWVTPLKPPIYKYSADPLIPIPLYARTVWVYQPSLAVAAILWYFRGVNEAGTPLSDIDKEAGSDIEDVHPSKPSPDSIKSGKNARSSVSNSHVSSPFSPSSSSSYFSPIQAETRGWTTPILFAIPHAEEPVSQLILNRRFRNELYLRGFNVFSRQLETEWVRRLEGRMRFDGPNPNPITGFIPGSLEGTWEGGFAYLDFPDYAQFLTGEREADAEFYSQLPEKMYAMNRQVWKLKEYELPLDPFESAPATANLLNGDTTMSGGGNQSSTGVDTFFPTRSSTSSGGGAATRSSGVASVSTVSSSSASSFYEPLRQGKWRDGWLPPAEVLQWRFPDDCGDELEIVESIVVDTAEVAPSTSAPTGLQQQQQQYYGGSQPIERSSTLNSFSSSSRGGGDEDSLGWAKEKTGVSGRLFSGLVIGGGQTSATATARPSQSATPVGTQVVEMAMSPREIPQRTSTTSPRSPEFDTTIMPDTAGFGGRRNARRESGNDEYTFGNLRRDSRSEEGEDQGTRREGFGRNVGLRNESAPRVVEKVSRYVRWDPNVAWAREAIWGSSNSEGSATGQNGRPGGMNQGGEWPVPKVRRQIRDILIFGESHSSWGEATIRGRVRSHDGLVTLVKNYPERATWIYTGYMIGGESFVGRWRDADSPDEVNGYEGPFAMKRRPRT